MSKNTKTQKLSHLTIDINNKIQGSFCLLLSNVHETLSKETWNSVYTKPQKLTKIDNSVIKTCKYIEDIVNAPYETRDYDKINALYENKETILSMERELRAYSYTLQRIEFIAEQLVMLKYVNEAANTTGQTEFNNKKIINDCIQFVQSVNPKDQFKRMKDVVKCFPIKMAKEKYFDYIKKCLNKTFNREQMFVTLNVISIYKTMLEPSAAVEYGRYFPEIANRLKELDKQLSTEEIENLTKIDHLYNEISFIRDSLFITFENLNFLFIIMNFAQNMGFLFNENFVIKDLYYKIFGEKNDDDAEIFSQRMNELLDEESEKVMANIDRTNEKAKKALIELNKENLSETETKDVSMWNLIYEHFYANLLDHALISNTETSNFTESTDEEYLTNEIEQLIDLLRGVLAKASPKMQRFLKSYFIDSLPCSFSMEEFIEYMTLSIEGCDSNAKVLAIAYNLYSMFADTDYINKDEFYGRKNLETEK